MLIELDTVKQIHTAENYKDACQLIGKEYHDLVLLDINLPDKSGINLLRSIKASDRDCDVIMISNSTGEYYRKQCKELGAMHFLDKTKDFEMVPGLVDKIGY